MDELTLPSLRFPVPEPDVYGMIFVEHFGLPVGTAMVDPQALEGYAVSEFPAPKYVRLDEIGYFSQDTVGHSGVLHYLQDPEFVLEGTGFYAQGPYPLYARLNGYELLTVVDGHHRTCAALARGDETIYAIVVEVF